MSWQGFIQKIAFQILITIITRYFILGHPPGWRYLVILLPLSTIGNYILILQTYAPETFVQDLFYSLSIGTGFLKLGSYAMNRGDLKEFDLNSQGLLQLHFILFGCVPIKKGSLKAKQQQKKEKIQVIKEVKGESTQVSQAEIEKQDLSLFTKFGLMTILMALTIRYPNMPAMVRYYVYGISYYLGLAIPMDILKSFINYIGIETTPSFNKPFMSRSVAEFWSDRWDITVQAQLKDLVYRPIIEDRLVAQCDVAENGKKRAGPYRRYAAQLSVFVASALMHIFIFWLCVRLLDNKWLIFFLIQFPIVALENLLYQKFYYQLKMQIPAAVKILATNVLIISLGGPLFVDPCKELTYEVYTSLKDQAISVLYMLANLGNVSLYR